MKTTILRGLMAAALCTVLLVSCDKYEDYEQDYDYSAVYFGSQKPLRTLVARDGQDAMQIKIGAVLGGVRENRQDHWVRFEIDNSLLPPTLKPMPTEWYAIEAPGNRITIPAGKMLGDVPVKFNKALLTADPLTLTQKYAIGLRLVETSADSILTGDATTPGKDYTVIAVKWISGYSGTYYVKGSQNALTGQGGSVVAGTTETYSLGDLSRNKTRDALTLSPVELNVLGVGAQNDGASNGANRFRITLSNGSVTLSQSGTSGVFISDLGSTYNASAKTFSLKYEYQKGGTWYRVDEQMILRQDPELDLRYEEWK